MICGVGSQTKCKESAQPGIEVQEWLPSKRFCVRCEVGTSCNNLSYTNVLCLLNHVWMFRVTTLISTENLVRHWSFSKWTGSPKLQRNNFFLRPMPILQSFEPIVKTMIEEWAHYVDMHQSSNFSCLPSLENKKTSQLKPQAKVILILYSHQKFDSFYSSFSNEQSIAQPN